MTPAERTRKGMAYYVVTGLLLAYAMALGALVLAALCDHDKLRALGLL